MTEPAVPVVRFTGNTPRSEVTYAISPSGVMSMYLGYEKSGRPIGEPITLSVVTSMTLMEAVVPPFTMYALRPSGVNAAAIGASPSMNDPVSVFVAMSMTWSRSVSR